LTTVTSKRSNRVMIRVKDLSKTFKVHKKLPGLKNSLIGLFKREYIIKEALQKVSFHVEAGEILGLVGANGAGKTTLVKILSGIMEPDSGSAEILGYTPWQRKHNYKKQISLLMGQKAQLWWDLPAEDCFVLLKEIYEIPLSRYNNTLQYLVEKLGVQKQLNIQIRRLSLGERMKMELIASLLHEPKIVFLDEPTIGLDLTAQRAIREFILEYRRSHRPAMILTSHYMEDIQQLCKRLAIMREGQIIYNGSLEGLQENRKQSKSLVFILKEPLKETKYLESLGIQPTFENLLKVKVIVPKESALDIASDLLKIWPVMDLSMSDDDLGSVIESVMRMKTP